MDCILKWIQITVSRRGPLGPIDLSVYHYTLRGIGWARAEYKRAKIFLIRSVEGTQLVKLPAHSAGLPRQ